MPRRHINAGPKPAGANPDPLRKLADQLHDEWAVKTGRTTWAELRASRKPDADRDASFASRRVAAKAAKQEAAKAVSLDDARKLLAAYISR